MQTFGEFLTDDINRSAIRKVSSYTASPVETCDRCSAGIKLVTLVTFADGIAKRYGSECINKVLKADNSLRLLYLKNQKLAAKYTRYLDIMKGSIEKMPRGREYFDSGLYFVGDGEGEDIFFNHWFFHPLPDWDKNQDGEKYVQTITPDEYKRKHHADILKDIPKLQAELDRLNVFCARVLQKYSAQLQQK